MEDISKDPIYEASSLQKKDHGAIEQDANAGFEVQRISRDSTVSNALHANHDILEKTQNEIQRQPSYYSDTFSRLPMEAANWNENDPSKDRNDSSAFWYVMAGPEYGMQDESTSSILQSQSELVSGLYGPAKYHFCSCIIPQEFKVHFGTITVREYDQVIGDNPAVSSGPSLTIGWQFKQHNPVRVDDFESTRKRRSSIKDLVLSRRRRERILLKLNYTEGEIAEAALRNEKVRNQRHRSKNSYLEKSKANGVFHKPSHKKKGLGFRSRHDSRSVRRVKAERL